MALFSSSQISRSQERSVRVLYFNDAHDPYMVSTKGGDLGGVSRMKSVVDSIRARHPEAILIFGGDLGGGTLAGKLFRGSVMVDFLNKIGVDYANYGQHDFDYGLENTMALTERSSFKWISSNTATTEGTAIPGSHTSMVHMVQGRRVGIIGLVDKVNTSSPRSGILQREIISSARRAIDELGSVDYVIAVTQMSLQLNEELLNTCSQIDLILSEESSQYMTNVSYIGRVPIVDGCGNMGHLTEVCLYEDGRVPTLSIHPITSDVTPDRELEESVQSLTRDMDERLGRRIASIPIERISSRHLIGNLVAEAFRDYYGTDLAMVQGGGIRAELTDSLVTLKDIYSILPYENRVIPVRLSGEELLELVRTALSDSDQPSLSGGDAELSDGLLTLTVGGEEVIPSRSYTIAISEFVTSGGGSFQKIPSDTYMIPMERAMTDADILIQYLSRH